MRGVPADTLDVAGLVTVADQVATDDPQTVEGPVIAHMGGAVSVGDHVLDNELLTAAESQCQPRRVCAGLLSSKSRSPSWGRSRRAVGGYTLTCCRDDCKGGTERHTCTQTFH